MVRGARYMMRGAGYVMRAGYVIRSGHVIRAACMMRAYGLVAAGGMRAAVVSAGGLASPLLHAKRLDARHPHDYAGRLEH